MVSDPRFANESAPPTRLAGTDTASVEAWPPSAHADSCSNKTFLLDQAYKEFCQRRDDGETLDPDVFCTRFPLMKSSLIQLLQAHLLMEESRAFEEIHWPEAGERFLDYQLMMTLGKGAFARVFLAAEVKLGNRLVAVKIALHGAAEAKVLGRINHPNIVPVHSVHEDPTTALTAVCMPYVGSATLCDVLDKAFTKSANSRAILHAVKDLAYPLDPTAARVSPHPVLQNGTYMDGIRLIGAQLAEALAFIHERGICHRDLKPSNVLMTPEGVPMLIDFNLCADAKETLNRLGGTLPYMSPEQLWATDREAAADAPSLDARSDLFSLGVILYQLVTGVRPFVPQGLKLLTAELRQLLLQRQREGPVPAHRINPNVDIAFSRLIQRCLEVDPRDRPQTAAAVASALRLELAPLRRTRRWISRHPRRTLAVALLLAALTVTGFAVAPLRPSYDDRPLETGLQLHIQGRFSEAVHRFNNALEADPNNHEALFARARAHQRLGETDEAQFNLAMQDYQELDRRAPHGRNKAAQGYCLNRTGQHSPAAECYKLAIEAGFGTAEVYNNLGFSYLQAKKKLAKAKECLDRATQLAGKSPAAYHNRALLVYFHVLRQLNQVKPSATDKQLYRDLLAGIADLQTAIELSSGSAESHLDGARLCAVASRVEKRWVGPALDHLEKAVVHGIDPKEGANPVFATLTNEPRFQALLNLARLTKKDLPSTQRIVDPIQDQAR